MFCPKCHTDLQDNSEYCRRCGTKIDSSRRKNSWSSFSFSKTFNRTAINNEEIEQTSNDVIPLENKTDHNESHENQYNYSKNYSDVIQDVPKTHQEQYNYNTNYSKITQDTPKSHQEQYNYSSNYSNTTIKQVVSESDYTNAYIGKNYNLFNQSFSICAMIFGPFYFLYRKLWSQGIILLIVYLFSYKYTTDNISMLLRITINIILAFKFNKIYLTEVEKRVQYIKDQNQNSTSNELLEECRKKGGTLRIKTIIIILVLFYIAIMVLLVDNRKTNNTRPIEEGSTIGNIIYKVPKTVVEKEHYPNYQTYKDIKRNGTCYISISTENSNYEPKDYLMKRTSTYDYIYQSELEETTNSNLSWTTKTITEKYTKSIFYITKINNNIYEFMFTASPPKGACQSDIEYIMNNIKTK